MPIRPFPTPAAQTCAVGAPLAGAPLAAATPLGDSGGDLLLLFPSLLRVEAPGGQAPCLRPAPRRLWAQQRAARRHPPAASARVLHPTHLCAPPAVPASRSPRAQCGNPRNGAGNSAQARRGARLSDQTQERPEAPGPASAPESGTCTARGWTRAPPPLGPRGPCCPGSPSPLQTLAQGTPSPLPTPCPCGPLSPAAPSLPCGPYSLCPCGTHALRRPRPEHLGPGVGAPVRASPPAPPPGRHAPPRPRPSRPGHVCAARRAGGGGAGGTRVGGQLPSAGGRRRWAWPRPPCPASGRPGVPELRGGGGGSADPAERPRAGWPRAGNVRPAPAVSGHPSAPFPFPLLEGPLFTFSLFSGVFFFVFF